MLGKKITSILSFVLIFALSAHGRSHYYNSNSQQNQDLSQQQNANRPSDKLPINYEQEQGSSNNFDQSQKPGSSSNFYDQSQKPGSSSNFYDQSQKPGSSSNFYDQSQKQNDKLSSGKKPKYEDDDTDIELSGGQKQEPATDRYYEEITEKVPPKGGSYYGGQKGGSEEEVENKKKPWYERLRNWTKDRVKSIG